MPRQDYFQRKRAFDLNRTFWLIASYNKAVSLNLCFAKLAYKQHNHFLNLSWTITDKV